MSHRRAWISILGWVGCGVALPVHVPGCRSEQQFALRLSGTRDQEAYPTLQQAWEQECL